MIPGYARCSEPGCETVRPVQNMFYLGGNPYCLRHVSSTEDRPAGGNHPLEMVIIEGIVYAGLLTLAGTDRVLELMRHRERREL